MKIRVLLTGALIFSFFLSAQTPIQNNSKIDSLISVCMNSRRNPVDFKANALKLLEVSKLENNTKGALAANQFLSRIALGQMQYQDAYNYCREAIKLAKTSKNDGAYHAITNTLAQVHFQTKYYDSALYYFRGNLSFLKNEARQKFQYYQTQRNIGNIFLRENKLDSAQYYLQAALKGFNAINNKMFSAQTYNMLAEVDLIKKNYDAALTKASKSLELTKAINFKPNLAYTYNLLGRIYDDKGDADQAETYFDLAEKSKIRPPKGSAIDASWRAKETSIADHKSKRINRLTTEKAFYQSNLFMALVILIGLGVIVFLLYKKNKISKREVAQLQNQLDEFNVRYKKLQNKTRESTAETHRLELPSGKLIVLEEVVYLKSDAHYVEIYLEETELPLVERISLSKLLKLLPNDGFIRTQKSYAVNIHKIKIINSTQLMMQNGTWVKLSPNYKAALKERLHAN